MALPAILSIGSVIVDVLDKFFPNQTEIKKADLELKKSAIEAEIKVKMAEFGLLTGQQGTNTAEAANPNRKWVTWRELLGYGLATAVWWDLVLKQFLVFVLVSTGSPIDLTKLPALDMQTVLFLLCGMLGIPIYQYAKGKLGSSNV